MWPNIVLLQSLAARNRDHTGGNWLGCYGSDELYGLCARVKVCARARSRFARGFLKGASLTDLWEVALIF